MSKIVIPNQSPAAKGLRKLSMITSIAGVVVFATQDKTKAVRRRWAGGALLAFGLGSSMRVFVGWASGIHNK